MITKNDLTTFLGKSRDYNRKELVDKYSGAAKTSMLIDIIYGFLENNELDIQDFKNVFYLSIMRCVDDDKMAKIKNLRKNFYKFIKKRWPVMHKYDYKEMLKKSGVYVVVEADMGSFNNIDIVYVGSTTNLGGRYCGHDKIKEVRDSDKVGLFYFKEMKTGFFDYELKLIKKLKPRCNKMHKGD